jgi:hypothetical protein
MDHPSRVERPYVHLTDEDKRQRREELADEASKRGKAIREAELNAFFAEHGITPRKHF